jgi:hypothetical protein
VRQLLDEPDRVRDEYARPRRGLQSPYCRVESREKLVRDQNLPVSARIRDDFPAFV